MDAAAMKRHSSWDAAPMEFPAWHARKQLHDCPGTLNGRPSLSASMSYSYLQGRWLLDDCLNG